MLAVLLGLLRKVAKYRRSVRHTKHTKPLLHTKQLLHTKHTKQLLHTKQLVFCVTAGFFRGDSHERVCNSSESDSNISN